MSNHARPGSSPGRWKAIVATVLSLSLLGGGAAAMVSDDDPIPTAQTTAAQPEPEPAADPLPTLEPGVVTEASATVAAAETVGGITTVDDMQSIVTSMFSFGFVDVLDNDTGDGLVLIDVVGATGAERGTTSFSPDGNVNYQTPVNFTGYEEFVYTVQDSAGATAKGRVRFGAEEKPQTPDLVLNQPMSDWGLTSNINEESDFRLVETPEWRAKAINGLLPTWRDLGTETAGPMSSNYEVLVGGEVNYAEHPFREVTFVVENFSRVLTRAGWYGSVTVPYQVESILDSSLVSEGSMTLNVPKPELDMQASTPYATAVAVPVLTQTWNVGYLSELVIAADNGVVTFVDNEAVYTPNPGFSGVDTFTVSALWDDPRYGRVTTLPLDIDVTVTVAPPDAQQVQDRTPFDTPKTIDLSGTDAASVASVGQGSNGSTAIVDGKVVYTPTPGFIGTETFVVDVLDPYGTPIPVTVTMTVDAPLNATDQVPYNTPKTIDLPAQTGIDSVTGTGQGAHGTVTISGDKVIYTPTPGFIGTDTFHTAVIDYKDDPATVVTTVTVGGPDDVQTSSSTPFETPKTVDVLTPAGGTAITGVTQGSHGSTAIVDGAVVYTPAAGFTGGDSFTATVNDAWGNPVNVIVVMTVGDVGAMSDQTPYNTPKAVDVLGQFPGTLTETADGANGTTAIVDGKVVYTPTPGFVGEDIFNVLVTDRKGATTVVVVTMTVGGPEDVALSTTTPYETPKTVDVLAESAGVEITATTQGVNGSAAIVDGQIVYTPNPGFSGPDEFTVTVLDEFGTPGLVVVSIVVGDVAQLATETPYNTAKTVDVVGATEGGTVAESGQGAHGRTELVDGKVVYTPNPGYVGVDTFTSIVTGADGIPTTVVVTVTVGGPEDVLLSTTTPYETPKVVEVGGGGVVETTQGSNGSVVANPDGTVTYVPNPGFSGEDTFITTVTDEFGTPVAVVVTVAVGDLVEATTETDYNVPVDVDVVGEAGGGVIGDVTDGTHGTVAPNEDGTVTYTPNPGYVGEDEFTVVVTDEGGNFTTVVVTVTVGAPEDVLLSTTTPYETPKIVDVLGESGGTAITGTTQGANGSVEVIDGQIVYTPNPGFSGPDAFTVTVTDEFGTPVDVVVTIAVGDIAQAEAETDYNVPVDVDVVGEVGGGSIADYTDGTHGAVVPNGDGTVTYTPNPGYVGEDVFTTIVTGPEGIPTTVVVTVTVGGPEDVPLSTTTPYETPKTIDVLGESGGTAITGTTQGTDGAVVVNPDGTVTYTPNPEFTGADRFTITVLDEFGTPVNVVVTIAVGDIVLAETETDYNVPVDVDVVGEVGGGSITDTTDGTNGTVTPNEDGTVTYTPNPGYAGEDEFTVVVTDEGGNPTTVVVIVTVGGPEDVLLATTTPYETPKTIDVLGESGGTAITGTTQGVNGSAEVIDGQLVYTPNPGFSGEDVVTVTVLDEFGTPMDVVVTIAVGDIVGTTTETDYNTSVDVDVIGETDGGSITDHTDGTHGTVTPNEDGTVTYTPDPGYVGEDEFTVVVTDEGGNSTTVVVTVTVGGPEDVLLSTTTPHETPKVVEVGGSGIVETTQGSNGSVVVNPDGTVTYSPNPGFSGEDTFVTTVTDEFGTPVDVVVTITVGDIAGLGAQTDYNVPADVDVVGEVGGGSIADYTDGTFGTVVPNEDGTVTYTPNPGYVGEDVFTTIVTGPEGIPTTVVVTVTVGGPEDVPLSTTTPYETPKTIDVLGESGGTAITGTTQGVNGSAEVIDGQVVYTPNPGFTGKDTVYVTVADEFGTPVTVVVTIAVGDLVETGTDTDYNTSVDVDVIGQTDGGSITDHTDGTHGTVDVDDEGKVTYTPDPGYVGEDEFTVVVTDEGGNSTTVVVTVTVGGPEDVALSTTTPYETPKTIDVLGESGGTAITGTTQGGNGSAEVIDGQIVYTPNPGFSGEDVVTVTVLDEFGTPMDVVVTIGVGDTVRTGTDTDYNTSVDVDVVGETDGGSITDHTDGTHGTVAPNEDGTVTYTPDPGYVGEDEFTVVVTDEDGNSTTVVVVVTVGGPEDVPLSTTTPYETPKTIDVLAESGGVEVTATTQGTDGAVVVNPDGTVTYVPNPEFTGVDRFTVTVLDEFGTPVNVVVTIAVGDIVLTETDTDYNTSVDVDVIGETDGGSITDHTDGTHGTVDVDDEGKVTYTPDPGFEGEDEFTVVVTDEDGNSTTVVVVVTVGGPEDVPQATTTPYETPKTIDVLGESGGTEITGTTQGVNGSAEVIDGQLVYTPNPGFSGEDVVTVTVLDEFGTPMDVVVTIGVGDLVETSTQTDYNVPVEVDVVGEAGGGSITDHTDGTHGTVTPNEDGTVTYTPNPGYVGEDQFTVVVTDEGGNSTTVVVTVTVAGPEGVAVTDETPYNTPKSVDVLTATGGGTVSETGQGSHGTVVIDGDRVVYTPRPGFIGDDTFTVIVADEYGTGREVVVTITVHGPEKSGIADETGYEKPKVIDPTGEGEKVTGTTDGDHGKVEIDGDGNLIYTPDPGFVGEDEFTVIITDEWGNEREVVIRITVNPPETLDLAKETPFETAKTIDILAETGAESIESVTQGEHGTVEIVDGMVVYTPEAGFSGVDTFTVVVVDADGNKTIVTVTMTVGDPEVRSGVLAALATTGVQAGLLVLFAAGAVTVGVVMTRVTRRRRGSVQS